MWQYYVEMLEDKTPEWAEEVTGVKADIIRDAIFRGADGGYLLTDRKFAGSDTLATSYALSCALRKIQPT